MRPIPSPRELGTTIRRARSDLRWAQAQLAARVHVGRPWLSELKAGKRTAALGRVLAVIEALGSQGTTGMRRPTPCCTTSPPRCPPTPPTDTDASSP